MIYVALLRGINVGGKARVEMARLKTVFEQLGHTNVVTYINSGNVIFESTKGADKLDQGIEAAIAKEFGFHVPVVIRDAKNIQKLNQEIPEEWTNGGDSKTDVLFLWQDYDAAKTLDDLTIKPDIDHVRYLPGAIVWHVDRKNINRSGLLRIVGTPLYKHVTIRNINTVRKLYALMQR